MFRKILLRYVMDKCKGSNCGNVSSLPHKINWIQHAITEPSTEPTLSSLQEILLAMQSRPAKQKCISILMLRKYRQADIQMLQVKKTITKPVSYVTNRSAIFFFLNKTNLPGIWRQAHYPDIYYFETLTNAFLLMFSAVFLGTEVFSPLKNKSRKFPFPTLQICSTLTCDHTQG